jgi:hypothetical protein
MFGLRELKNRVRDLEIRMAGIDDAIAGYVTLVETTFATIQTDINNVTGGVVALQNLIKSLQASIGTTVLSPNSQAMLAKLVADSNTLEGNLKAIDTSIPTSPAQGS